MDLISSLVLLVAGLGAGVMTGLIGASAVTLMAGILITVLGYGAYLAIGFSLITDVFASLISAHIYRKAKNIALRRGLMIGVIATIFAFLGSLLARLIPELALGDGLGIVTLITGIAFLNNPLQRKETKLFSYFRERKIMGSVLIGIFVGLFCGIFGVGGGVTILVVLVFVLNYPIKVAVGTSVLIMAFISLSGGIGHFIGKPFPLVDIIIASVGGMIGAGFSSKYANRVSEAKMFKISGIVLIILSLVVIFKKFFPMFTLFLI